jgi:hypothetical protein
MQPVWPVWHTGLTDLHSLSKNLNPCIVYDGNYQSTRDRFLDILGVFYKK